MFEGWASELLASYLGHFFDVKREQLRISLWSAWSTGLVLTDLRLKPAAFDALQLPCAVVGGRVGRLEVQVPWRALGSRPVVLEVSDVWLEAAPWGEGELHAGAAGRRARAAKEAQLLAAGLARASWPAGGGPEARGGLAAAFLSHLARLLLHKLQLRVHSVHLRFSEAGGGQRLGLRLRTLAVLQPGAAEGEGRRSADEPAQGGVCKSVSLDSLCVYLEDADAGAEAGEAGGVEAGQEGAAAAGPEGPAAADMLLAPLRCSARVAMPAGSSTVSVEAQAGAAALRLHARQLACLARLAEAAATWARRVQFAELRPPEWRAGEPPPWRRVWAFAIGAVLQQLRASPGRRTLRGWQARRREYVRLHQRRLRAARAGRIEGQDAEAALARLEQALPVADILAFRSLAERGLGHLERSGSCSSTEGAGDRPRGWAPGFWALLGSVSAAADAPPLPPPSEADLAELAAQLDFDPQAAAGGGGPSGRLELQLDAAVAGVSLDLADGREAGGQLLRLELGRLQGQASTVGWAAEASLAIASLEALDCSCGPGVQHSLLTAGSPGAEQPPPAIELLVLTQQPGEQGEASVEVEVQPLQLRPCPALLARLAALLACLDASDSLEAREMAAVNALSSPQARALAKAQMVAGQPQPLAFRLKVLDCALLLGEGLQLRTGVLSLARRLGCGREAAEQLTAELAAAGPHASQALCTQVRERLLYTELQLEAAALRCDASERERSEALLLPLRLGGALRLCRLLDTQLPGVDCRLQAATAHVRASPFAQAAAAAAAQVFAAAAGGTRPEADGAGRQAGVWEQPPVRASLALAGLDLRLQLPGQGGAQLEAALGASSLEGLLSARGFSAEASLGLLQVAAACEPEGQQPPWLRLARELQLDSARLLARNCEADGLLVSAELMGLTACGPAGEPADSVLEARPEARPAVWVTHRRPPKDAPATRLTLADLSFGAGALLRLAGLLAGADKGKTAPAQQPPPVFALELLRCRAVCPGGGAAPEGCVLSAPRLLLRLPLGESAPDAPGHPIQDSADGAAAASQPPLAADGQEAVLAIRRLSLLVPGHAAALLSVPSVQLLRRTGGSVPAFEATVPAICLDASPPKVQAVAAAAAWLQAQQQAGELPEVAEAPGALPPASSAQEISSPEAQPRLQTVSMNGSLLPHAPQHIDATQATAPGPAEPVSHAEGQLSSEQQEAPPAGWQLSAEVTRVSAVLWPDEPDARAALALDARLLTCRLAHDGGSGWDGQLRLAGAAVGMTSLGRSGQPAAGQATPQVSRLLAGMRRTASAPVAGPLDLRQLAGNSPSALEAASPEPQQPEPGPTQQLVFVNASPQPQTYSLSRVNSTQVAPAGLAEFASLQEPSATARAAAQGASASRSLEQPLPASSPSQHGSLASTSMGWRRSSVGASPRRAPSARTSGTSRASSAALSEASEAPYLSARSSSSGSLLSDGSGGLELSGGESGGEGEASPQVQLAAVLLQLQPPPGAQDAAALLLQLASAADAGLTVAAQPLHVELSLEGGEDAVVRLQQCAAALAEVSWPEAAPPAGQPDAAATPPAGVCVTLAAAEVAVSLAAPSRLESAASPGKQALTPEQGGAPRVSLACGVRCRLRVGAAGLAPEVAEIAALTVDLAVVSPSKEDGRELDAGRLLAVRRAELRITPRGGERPAAQPRAALGVQRAAVWASGRRLAVLAALAANVRQVARRVRERTSARDTTAVAAKTPGASGVAAALDGCHLSVGCLAAVLSTSSSRGQETSLFEAALLGVEASARLSGGLLLAHADAALRVDVFSNVKRGWEPVAERWPFALQLEHATYKITANGGLHPGQTTLSLTSKQPLELTAAPSLVKAGRVAALVLERAAAVLQAPQTLAAAAAAPNGDLQLLGNSTFELRNGCGAGLRFWLRSEGEEPPEAAEGGEPLAAGSSRELLLSPSAPGNADPRFAGTPAAFLTDSFCPGAAAQLAEGGLAAGSQPTLRSERRALFFCLAGQEVACGPVSLAHSSSAWLEASLRLAGGGPVTARLHCRVAHRPTGGCRITLSSGVQVVNRTGVAVDVRLDQSAREPWRPASLAPGGRAHLPALRPEPGTLALRPAGAGAGEQWAWSVGVRLQPLLEQRAASAGRVARTVVCQSTARRQPGREPPPGWRFHLGLVAAADGCGWEVQVRPPLVLRNALPVEVSLSLKLRGGGAAKGQAAERVKLEPGGRAGVHEADVSLVEALVLKPLGYQWSAPVAVPPLPPPLDRSDGAEAAAAETAEAPLTVPAAAPVRGLAALRLRHSVEPAAGGRLLTVGCTAWVFNCAGLPIALRPASEDDARETADTVPDAWVPPYAGAEAGQAGGQPLNQPRSPAPPRSARAGGQGLADAALLRTGPRGGAGAEGPRLQGQASGELPPHDAPSKWPSLQGGLQLRRGRLGLQLRLSQMRAGPGRSLWSAPVRLDAMGGAAVVSVPYPVPGAAAGEPDYRAAYTLAVSATQEPAGDGALAVTVRPRYLLHNRTAGVVQYRQQGCGGERELGPGAARPLHWPDAGRPPRLCVRPREAGWQWSGGLGLDSPGDFFVKTRHKDRGVTRLLRVDVAVGHGGVLAVALSDQGGGFAPYRVDNCTYLTLHLSQQAYREQEDVLRPYSCLGYAWDEPSLPHRLALALPGNRRLGAFDLDSVGQAAMVSLRRQPEGERQLQVLVRTEGPTRVLAVTDLQKHLPLPASAPASLAPDALGWESWSGGLSLSRGALGQVAVPPAGLRWEVRAQLAGVGVSLVSGDAELLYCRAGELRARLSASAVRGTAELRVDSVQVDNPLRQAAYPVLLACPTVAQRAGISLLADTRAGSGGEPTGAALVARAAAWRRRPAGVLCLELAEVHVAPLALELEQEHLTALAAAAAASLAAPQPHGRLPPAPSLPGHRGARSPRAQPRQEAKLYIERLLVGELTVTLSYLPADWARLQQQRRAQQQQQQQQQALAAGPGAAPGARLGRGLQQLLSLAGEVEGGCVRLSALEMRHPLLGLAALRQQANAHYMRAALPQLVKLLGSANLLGDPVRVFHHLGLGVWALLASPAAGLVQSARGQGPRRLAAGLGVGVGGLLGNVLFAAGRATAKASGSAKKVLALLGAEQAGGAGLPLRQRRRLGALDERPAASLIAVLLRSLVGLLAEPIRGYDERGPAGLVVGAYKGVAGALVRPLASLLEAAARLADSLAGWVVGPPAVAPRVRPPRAVAPVRPLAPYDEMQAAGRFLLGEVAGQRFAAEEFGLCRRLACGAAYLLLTGQHALRVAWPGLRFLPALAWALRLEDLLHVRRQRCGVHLLALRPPELRVERPAVAALSPQAGAPREPLHAFSLEFQDEADAAAVEEALRQAAARACRPLLGAPQRFGSAEAALAAAQARAESVLAQLAAL